MAPLHDDIDDEAGGVDNDDGGKALLSAPANGAHNDFANRPASEPAFAARATADTVAGSDPGSARALVWWLYVSHLLSMWNSRIYEYGAILFIQAAFPGNLLPSSINGIAETVCVLVSSSALGHWIDGQSSRLRPLILTMTANRGALVLSCLLWIILFFSPRILLRSVLFAIILALGMLEKAARMGNTLSMERDWVPTLADEYHQQGYSLTHLNTVMRRIDILCKFVAPLVVSALVAATEPEIAAMVVGACGALSLLVELWSATRVWKQSHALRKRKRFEDSSMGLARRSDTPGFRATLDTFVGHLRDFVRVHVSGLAYYFASPVWFPSVGTAVLHASVLAWSGTLITWLLNAGFPLAQVTVAKGVGSVFEISSTFVFPWAVGMLLRAETMPESRSGSYEMVGQRSHEVEEEEEEEEDTIKRKEVDVGSPADEGESEHPHPSQTSSDEKLDYAVITVAKWSLYSLAATLIPTLISLFFLDASIVSSSNSSAASDPSIPPAPTTSATVTAVIFYTFLSLSFLGRWTYDLAATQLTLMLIPPSHRSAFGGTEMAIVSCVSLVHWVAAAVWHAQGDFKWLGLASFVGVCGAVGGYWRWARRWRRRTAGEGRE